MTSAPLRQLKLLEPVRETRHGDEAVVLSFAGHRLRAVIVEEYLEKLPQFVPIGELPRISGRSLPELEGDADAGLLLLTKRDGFVGMIPRDNVPFLHTLTLLRTPSAAVDPGFDERATEQVTVSAFAYRKLVERADEAGCDVSRIVDEMLKP